jgi:phosphatidate cytidylyltransferase
MKNFLQRLITGIFLILLAGGMLLSQRPWVFPVGLSLMLFEIIFFEWPKFAGRYPRSYRFTPVPAGVKEPNYWLWLLLIPYLIVPFGLLMVLDQQPFGRDLIILMCLVTPAFDVGAYFLGRLIGRHQLCVSISPNKTWEGLIGGTLAVTAMFLVWQAWHAQVVHLNLGLIGLIFLISLLAAGGDLFESWLKRRASLKDAGQLLPGHGGLLDRLDSILFVTWLFYFGRAWITELLF